jgi:hypothetical protein
MLHKISPVSFDVLWIFTKAPSVRPWISLVDIFNGDTNWRLRYFPKFLFPFQRRVVRTNGPSSCGFATDFCNCYIFVEKLRRRHSRSKITNLCVVSIVMRYVFFVASWITNTRDCSLNSKGHDIKFTMMMDIGGISYIPIFTRKIVALRGIQHAGSSSTPISNRILGLALFCWTKGLCVPPHHTTKTICVY